MTTNNQQQEQKKEEILKVVNNKLLAIQTTSANIVNWFSLADMDDSENFENLARSYVEEQVFLMLTGLDVLSSADLSGNIEYIDKINQKIRELEKALIITDQNVNLLVKFIESQGMEFQKKVSDEVEVIKSKYNV